MLIAKVTIASIVGTTAMVLSVLFLPSFVPLLMGVILSIPIIMLILLTCLGIPTIFIWKCPTKVLMAVEVIASILSSIVSAILLLTVCSTSMAMLAMLAVGGGCVTFYTPPLLWNLVKNLVKKRNDDHYSAKI